MWNTLKRLFGWIGDNFLGHALFDGVKNTIKDGSQQITAETMNRLTRKDLLLGVIFARLGTMTEQLTPARIAEGIRKMYEFHGALNDDEQDLFERLFFRDVLDAIQEYLKEKIEKVEELTDGKVTKVTHAQSTGQQKMHQQYFALVGLAGPAEIRLEMRRLHQMTPLARGLRIARQGHNGMEELFRGFADGWKGR